MSESDIVLLDSWVQRRDAEAFKVLATRYAGMVYGTCKRILDNPAEAEDVAQECFEILATTQKPVGQYLAPWLHRVACNRSLTRLRSEHRRKEREAQFAAGLEAGREPVWDDIYGFVDEAIAQLPDPLRIPIVAHFLDDQTHSAIALTLGVPRSTITDHIDKGIELIRKTLKSRGVGVTGVVLAGLIKANVAEAAPSTLVAELGRIALSGRIVTATTGTSLLGGLLSLKGALTMSVLVAALGFAGYETFQRQKSNSAPQIAQASPAPSTPDTSPVVFTYQPIDEVATPEPEPSSTWVSGRVLQPDGHPIPDATIEVLFPREPEESGLSERDVAGKTSSDGLGAYSLLDLPVGRILTVVITHPDWALGGGQLSALSQNEKRDEIDFVLHPAVSISGTVVSEHGIPIAGATVFLRELNEPPPEIYEDSASTQAKTRSVYPLGALGDSSYLVKTETDATGKFRLHNIPDGFILGELGAEKQGYAPGWAVSPESQKRRETTGNGWWNARRITLPAQDIRIVLGEAGVVTGKVVHVNTRAPVAEAKVYIEGLTQLLDPFSGAFARYDKIVSTDTFGHFDFENVPSGDVNLYAVKEGARSPAVRVTVARGYANNDILLQMVSEGAIEGHVYDAETGAPIEEMLLNYNQRGIGSTLLVASTGKNGSYRINQLVAGVAEVGPRTSAPYKLSRARHPEAVADDFWIRLKVPVEPGKLTGGVDLYCEPNERFSSYVRGKVLDVSGRPAVGAIVTIRGRGVSGTTDKNGEYVLSVMTPGECTVLAIDSLEATYGTKQITVELGKETRADIRLESPTSRISGSVVHRDRSPASVSIQIVAVENGDMATAVRPRTDGTFEAVLLPGFYAISPAAENAAFKPTPAQYDIRLGEGEKVTDLDFVLEQMDGFVAGTVYYANGEPAGSLTVTATGNGIRVSGVTDASGHFLLHPVEGENLTVQVGIPQNPIAAWATVSPVSEGKDDLSIILEDLGAAVAD